MNASLRACPEPGDIARSASQGANAELQAHLAACPACAEDWRVQREMSRLGSAVPFNEPEPGQQRQVRLQVLERLAIAGDLAPAPPLRPRRSRRRPLLAGAAGAVAAAAVVLLRSSGREAKW